MKNLNIVKSLSGTLFFSLAFGIAANAQDAGVSALLSPTNLSCGSSSGMVTVIVSNYGTSSISNIPVKLTSTGTSSFSLLDTLKKTIPTKGQDTLTFSTTINTFNGGSYNFKIYTLLSGDINHKNDTLGVTLKINAMPNTPVGRSFTSCGGGLLSFKAPSTSSGSITYWYSSPTSSTPISSGDSLAKYVSSTTTYYASSASGTAFNSLTNTFNSGTGIRGDMFDVNIDRTLNIDSFDISTYSAVTDTAYFYYKQGTYSGFQSSPAAWTFVGKIPINTSTAGKVRANFKKSITLSGGNVYGLYITLVGTCSSIKVCTYNLAQTNSTDSSYNLDLTIRSGDALSSKFGGNSNPYRWNGTIYYSAASCTSPRVPVTATVLTPVKNIVISKDKTSAGAFNSGTRTSQDEICVGDTLKYDLSSPSNYLNSDYGTKWKLSFSLKTLKGTSTANYAVTYPSATSKGEIIFYPKAKDADSVYVLTGAATNFATGCDSVFTRYIHVNQHPVSKFTAANVCFGKALSITNSSMPTGQLNFIWDFGDGDSSHSGTPPYKYAAPGTYQLKLTAFNAGCSDSSTQTEVVYNAPYGSLVIKGVPFEGQYNSGIFIDPDNICIGDTNNYLITPPKGLTNSDYGTKWAITSLTLSTAFGLVSKDTLFKVPNGGNKSASLSFFPTKYADSVFILAINLRTFPGNCDSQIIRYIHVWIKPVPDFSFTNACMGLPIVFKDLSKVAVSNVTSWIWDFGDGKTGTAQNPSHIYANPGLYKVTLTAATDAGCGASISKTVEEFPRASVNFNTSVSCNGFSSAFSDASTISGGSISSWRWSFGDGSGANTQSASNIYSKSGPYNVKLVVISNFGCIDSLIKRVVILPKPVAKFSYKNACVGSNVFISNSSIDSSNQSSYSWNFGDAVTSTLTSPSHIYNANGSYKITLKVTSKSGCTDTASQTIVPNPKPDPNIFITGACTGQSVSMADSSHSGTNSIYAWTYGDGTTTYTSSKSFTAHSYKSPGSYTVSLVLTNGGGCIDSEKKVIVISSFPKAGFTASNVCEGDAAEFVNTSSGSGALAYSWNFGDNSKGSSAQNASHNYATPGIYHIKLAATNSSGCADTFRTDIVVNPKPQVPAWTYGLKKYTVSFIPKDTNYKSFTWYFGTASKDTSNAKEPVFTYPSVDAKYVVKLVVVSDSGCSAESFDTVTVSNSGIAKISNNIREITVYPNPFESGTSISYQIASRSKINVAVYDLGGNKLTTLRDGIYDAGNYVDIFNAGKCSIAEGVYMLKIIVDDNVYTRRIVYIK